MDKQFALEQDKCVLFVGLACMDLFQILQKYPTEDLGHRCLDSYWQRGGNAGNSATVFSILGGCSEFFGTLSTDKELQFIQRDFKGNNVSFQNCVYLNDTSCPLSVVIISKESHSRTVLHTNKNLPELTAEHFKQNINLNSSLYGWIHFEGRDNAREIEKMLQFLQNYNRENAREDKSFKKIILSLEAEKLRLSAELIKYDMWRLPDVMFVSKDFALSEGFSSMVDAVTGYFPRMKEGGTLICAWGEEGAAAISAYTGIVTSPALKPLTVVDTCGAGDSFIAATILALSRGKQLQDAITFGCKVAGTKCGIQGFQNLKGIL